MTNKNTLQTLINQFSDGDLKANALALFKELGYQSPRTFNKPVNEMLRGFDHEKALCSEWIDAPFLFQLAEDNLSHIQSLLTEVDGTIIESYLFVAIELKKSEYSRTQLVTITRELNKSPQPVLILFKHGDTLTLSVIHRRLHKRDDTKDVLEKVTLLKDIRISNPHRAHVDILFELAFENLKPAPKNFVELHNTWQAVLDTKTLNKQFYKELSQWYFWAMKEVYFPDAGNIEAVKGGIFEDENKVREHNAKSLIRLLTRLLFVWFIKEKNLIPEQLFNEDWIKSQLAGFKLTPNASGTFQGNESHFYRAILQNLFFATLNQTRDKRGFRNDGQHRNVTNLMRYQSYFSDPDAFLKLVSEVVPFMNGGLFDCLDKPLPDLKGKQGGDVIAYEDGFSDRPDNQLKVPDYIFFGSYKNIDLSEELGNKQKSVEIKGLCDILKSYKFTITENTPLEEDIALDPELLGQVFENLLASYNPETKTTARKQTGSFYTPREIVDYMVDESLKAYFKSKTPHVTSEQLDDLLSYTQPTPEFSEADKTALIEAIDTCKILDPACGSGAFPMGVLHKLVFILGKLDPDNELWKQRQIERTPDSKLRKQIIEAFTDNEVDYARKLYLIENCIYGVDIQAIAIQISKLRFFISLIVDQKIDNQKTNFGVLPLPNLETKFVAANTLIGIEKPKKQTSLFDSKAIDALEDQLKKVRHSLFSVRTPSRKRELRDEDKQLREQIGQLLAQHGWGNETAQQLAQWNPYDQNANANFFDVEWMFGENGFDIVIGNPPYVKEYTSRKAFDGLRNSPHYQGKMDLWYLFACHNIGLLKNKTGVLTFIATNNWTTNSGASKMRNTIIQDAKLEKIIDFGSYMIFESADIQTMIMLARKDNAEDNYQLDYRRITNKQPTFNDVLNLLNCEQTENNEILNPTITKTVFLDKTLTFSNNQIDIVLQKILQKGNLFLNKNEVANGIHPHYDYVNKNSQKILGNNFHVGQGIFVLSEEEKELLNLTENELKLLKPYYSTKQLSRWFGNSKNSEWIIYTDSQFKKPETIKPYPNLKNHLDQFQSVITSDNKPYGLHRARAENFFKNEKIIALRKCVGMPIFTYTDFDCYVSATFYVIKTHRVNQKYLTAFLNSKLLVFWLKNKGKMQGNNYQIDKEPLLEIPIFKPSESEQQPFIDLVDKILVAKKAGQDTRDLEQEIDMLVYGLYGLSDEEVAIVEGGK